MPFFNKTGPQGEGPLTGKCFGPCADNTVFGFGRRFGCGRGFGFRRGFQSWFSKSPTQAEIKEGLKSYKKYLEEELEAVKNEQSNFEEIK